MNKLMVVCAVAVLGVSAFADKFYVDAVGGDDDWDGSAEVAAPDVETSRKGPMKTLAAVAAKAKAVASASNPCTIIALPGEYKEGISNPDAFGTAMTLNRVTLAANITLKSRDGKEKTFIMGAKSDAPNATAKGCGTNAVRCVKSGTVQGFTLTGARVFSASSSSGDSDGGAASTATLIDCIVTNNVAYRGGGNYYGTNIRCYFNGNTAFNGPSSVGSASYNSLFVGEQAYQGSVRNCTFARSSYPREGACYNCLVMGTGSSYNGGPKFYHCYHVEGYTSDAILDDECVVYQSAASIKVDSAGFPTNSTSAIIDAGSEARYYQMRAEGRKFDINHLPRLQNGKVDIGCYEHNPCADFSAVLSPDGAIAVTNVSSLVTGLVDSVSIGTNQVLRGTLELYDASETTWSFFAEVKGTGSLKVYFADGDEPGRTLTASDGLAEVTYTAAATTGLRLVYEGTYGAAEVGRFSNATRVLIAAAGAEGLAISGDYTAAGEYHVAAGETKTVAFNRANQGLVYVSGIIVNGTFYNLYEYPDGLTFTIDGSDRSTAITVETVTASTKEIFVDRVNGSDLNCGIYTNLAFQSLAKAASVATSGWTILAMPGVYDNEVSNPEAYGTATVLNRVTVPNNVTLKAVGKASETIIMGAKSDAPNATPEGCGTNAVRCVHLNGAASMIIGFTVSGGRTLAVDGLTGFGGGVCSSSDDAVGKAVDCVITNCCAYRGGGTAYVNAYRCVYVNNLALHSGTAAYYEAQYGCLFDNCHPYLSTTYNCTFLRGGYARGGSHYNAVCLSYGTKYINGPKFYNCYFSYRPDSYSSPVLDDDCVVTNAAALPVDAEGRPLAGSLAIDAGRTDYFERTPEQYRDTDIFGGQRVYNGKVDVGCGEFDWRGDFAKTLATKDVEVEAATANVTTNLAEGLSVPAGESLKLKLLLKTDGAVSFKAVAGEGATVVVTVGGEPVVPGADGTVGFAGAAGETYVEIAVTGEGQAVVSDVKLPKLGMLFLIR